MNIKNKLYPADTIGQDYLYWRVEEFGVPSRERIILLLRYVRRCVIRLCIRRDRAQSDTEWVYEAYQKARDQLLKFESQGELVEWVLNFLAAECDCDQINLVGVPLRALEWEALSDFVTEHLKRAYLEMRSLHSTAKRANAKDPDFAELIQLQREVRWLLYLLWSRYEHHSHTIYRINCFLQRGKRGENDERFSNTAVWAWHLLGIPWHLLGIPRH